MRRATAYIPAIDGLRALAIVAVFVYHANTRWLPGGFLGVDIFFAISGFLITRGLLTEHALTGRVDLRQFWIRRARRLLPAALVFIFVLIAAAQAFFPGDVRALRGVALSAVAYGTNWFLIFSNLPYFETVGRPQLLQHLWSLAVEEQFYLVWPPLLLLAVRLVGRRGAFVVTLLLGAGSTLLMAVMYRGGTDVSRLYYGTDTHAVGLLFGAALAFAEPLWRAREGWLARRALQLSGIAALLVTAFLLVWLAEWRPFLYQGGFAVTAVVSLVLIVAASVSGPFAAVFGSAPLRWIGERSYSIYLWHPPLLALFAAAQLTVPQPVVVGLAAIATVLVADLSYRWIEEPIRSGAIRRAIEEFRMLRRDTRWTIGFAASTAFVAVIAGAAFAPPRTPPAYLAVAQINGVLTAPTADPTAYAPSWVVPRDAVGAQSPAEPVSRSIVPVRTPTAGLTVRSLSAVVTATPTPTLDVPVITAATATATVAPNPVATGARASSAAPTFAIGDSVMLGAANGLANAFGTIEVDAAIGRDAATTLRILRERRAAGRLPSTVIVQVGNNGPMSRPQMEELMSLLSGVPRAVVVDLHVPQPWEKPNNAMLAEAVARHPGIRLVPWHDTSGARTGLFWDDMHLRPEGVELYVGLITAALP